MGLFGINLRIRNFFQSFFKIERDELLKVLYLSLVFFLIIGAYTVSKELKDAVFTTIIGYDRKYLAWAKILSMFVLVPAIFFHSRLVDLMRRHQLIYFYTAIFGVVGLIFSFMLGNETIGLHNTISSPYRIFGWVFYFFIEWYSPLVVSLFWAFVNSITKPGSAKNNYTLIITASKIGGIVTSLIASLYLSSHVGSDVANLQILLIGSSLILLLVPLVMYFLVTKVPKKELHGYEAAYKFEKQKGKEDSVKEPVLKSMASGLMLLFRYPYTMGIFGMVFFFELVNQVIKVENIIFGKATSATLSEFTGFLLWQAMLVHIVGFFVVVFGTRIIIQSLGERRSLMLVPALTGLSVIGFLVHKSYLTAIIAFVVTRSLNYALAVPLRESLYIPTIKDIKFKTKSWIDGIGSKFAKMSASSFNMYADGLIGQALLAAHSAFFIVIISLWFIASYALGRRFEKAVKKNEVIGLPK